MKKFLGFASTLIILGIFSTSCDNIDIPDFMKDEMQLGEDGDLDFEEEEGVL